MKVIVREAGGGSGFYEIVYASRGRLKGTVLATAERLQMSDVEFRLDGTVRGNIDSAWGIEGEWLTLFRRSLGIDRPWRPLPGNKVWREEGRGWLTLGIDFDFEPYTYTLARADRLQLTGVAGLMLAIGAQ
jgi:hypothetical protein